MSLNNNGVSTTTERDCFRSETFKLAGGKGTRVQWDYRDIAGELHSGVARDTESAIAAAKKFGYQG